MPPTAVHRRTWLKAAAGLVSGPAFAAGVAPAAATAGPAVVPLGGRRELFVDDFLVASLEGLRRVWHRPVPREVAIEHDAPWEGTGTGYHSVLEDGGRYRMYYRAGPITLEAKAFRAGTMVVCMAESDDGLVWNKPSLGLVASGGSKANNIVLDATSLPDAPMPVDPGHLGGVIIDERPGVDPGERYKAFLGVQGETALLLIGSADGVRFRLLEPRPVLTGGQFDTQNVILYDPVGRLYRSYCRGWGGQEYTGTRGIRTATSPDARHWSEFRPLEYTDPAFAAATQLYTNAVKPYARAPHLLVGLPVRYVEKSWDDSLRALPQPEERRRRSEAQERFGTALTETLFMTSRDGVRFDLHDEAFLRPGIERDGTWLYGQQYPAYQLVETRSALDPRSTASRRSTRDAPRGNSSRRRSSSPAAGSRSTSRPPPRGPSAWRSKDPTARRSRAFHWPTRCRSTATATPRSCRGGAGPIAAGLPAAPCGSASGWPKPIFTRCSSWTRERQTGADSPL
jgi:hypothetical protein